MLHHSSDVVTGQLTELIKRETPKLVWSNWLILLKEGEVSERHSPAGLMESKQPYCERRGHVVHAWGWCRCLGAVGGPQPTASKTTGTAVKQTQGKESCQQPMSLGEDDSEPQMRSQLLPTPWLQPVRPWVEDGWTCTNLLTHRNFSKTVSCVLRCWVCGNLLYNNRKLISHLSRLSSYHFLR